MEKKLTESEQKQILAAFLAGLSRHGADWRGRAVTASWKTTWTQNATDALVATGQELVGQMRPPLKEIVAAAKGHRVERTNRSEHLALDVVVYEEGFGPIHFAAEHENKLEVGQLRYCAWKLLHVHARFRVLVGYFDAERKKGKGLRSVSDLVSAIEQVTEKVDGQFLLIAGNRTRTPGDKTGDSVDFNTVFQSRLVGVPRKSCEEESLNRSKERAS